MFMDFIKKQSIASWLVLAGSLISLIAIILFLVNATNGWFAGQYVNAWIPVCSFSAILIAICSVVFYDKIKLFADILIVLAIILLGLSLAMFIFDRIDIFANVWMIPVPNSETEIASANGALAGIIFYGISILILTGASFFPKLINRSSV